MVDGVDLGIEGLTDFQEIGSGGFATVYSAHDEGFDRRVVVKVLHSVDDDGRRRFDRERGLMGTPNNAMSAPISTPSPRRCTPSSRVAAPSTVSMEARASAVR